VILSLAPLPGCDSCSERKPGVARFSLAYPGLNSVYASGVQNAARRAAGRVAPGGAQRHPGSCSESKAHPGRGARIIWTALTQTRKT
jgi:hypothetical protein